MTAGMTMTEYRMPDPPEGYEWVVSTYSSSIYVDLKGWGKQTYSTHQYQECGLNDAERNARTAVALAHQIIDYINNPPQPPPEPSFNGLTGYRREYL